ncbi:hypothetical protein ERO13_A11G310566v2 [Gossypium hirsutum]|nr:hypothetical protein ERO13_A11G310566v2 [Gossypium hirsutum]
MLTCGVISRRRDRKNAAFFSHIYLHSKFRELGIHVLQGLSAPHLSSTIVHQ